MNWFRKKPWFSLLPQDGGEIRGQVLRDKSLELHVEIGWAQLLLKLSPQEVDALLQWLEKTYRGRTDGKPAPVISIFDHKKDT
jgi:hypothetical protein